MESGVRRTGMTRAGLVIAFLICAFQTNGASRKFLIEIISVSQTFHFVVGQPTTTIYDANVILPDGSHAHIQCLQDAPGCGSIDNGQSESEQLESTRVVKRASSGKFQPKRNGKWLEIYTVSGKRRYEIVGTW